MVGSFEGSVNAMILRFFKVVKTKVLDVKDNLSDMRLKEMATKECRFLRTEKWEGMIDETKTQRDNGSMEKANLRKLKNKHYNHN